MVADEGQVVVGGASSKLSNDTAQLDSMPYLWWLLKWEIRSPSVSKYPVDMGILLI